MAKKKVPPRKRNSRKRAITQEAKAKKPTSPTPVSDPKTDAPAKDVAPDAPIGREKPDSVAKDPESEPSAKKQRTNASKVHHTATLRSPQWTYFHLTLFSESSYKTRTILPPSTPKGASDPTSQQSTPIPPSTKSRTPSPPPKKEPLDTLTVHTQIKTALSRFLGLHGAAIPIDILKIEEMDVWIRAPFEDGTAVHEAVSAWVGVESGGGGMRWIVRGRDEWLVRLGGGNGQGLFSAELLDEEIIRLMAVY